MNDTICYLNTDLDLTSSDDLTALAAAFEATEMSVLHCERAEDGLWSARFERFDRHDQHQPELDIADMLTSVESLGDSLRAIWSGCMRREFNIGYDCGSKPWAFNQGLSHQLVKRIAEAGASLRMTLYPPTCETSVEPGAAADSPREHGASSHTVKPA